MGGFEWKGWGDDGRLVDREGESLTTGVMTVTLIDRSSTGDGRMVGWSTHPLALEDDTPTRAHNSRPYHEEVGHTDGW